MVCWGVALLCIIALVLFTFCNTTPNVCDIVLCIIIIINDKTATGTVPNNWLDVLHAPLHAHTAQNEDAMV